MNDDRSMLDLTQHPYYCLVCGKTFEVKGETDRKDKTRSEDIKGQTPPKHND